MSNKLIAFEVADGGVVGVSVHVQHLLCGGDGADVDDDTDRTDALGG